MTTVSIPSRHPADLAQTTGRVYVASSLSTFKTFRYDAQLARIRGHFPQAEILPARDLFHSNADWLRKWPELLPTLDVLIFFADTGRSIGYGVWTELTDAAARGIPSWYLASGNRLYDLGDSEHLRFHLRPWDWTRYAVVTCPRPDADALDWRTAAAKGGA